MNYVKLFKPKPKNQIEMEVSGINPETNNEFLFYNFIENTPNYILEPWLKKANQIYFQSTQGMYEDF